MRRVEGEQRRIADHGLLPTVITEKYQDTIVMIREFHSHLNNLGTGSLPKVISLRKLMYKLSNCLM